MKSALIYFIFHSLSPRYAMLYAQNSFPLYLTQQPVCTGDAVPPALILIQTKVSEKKVKKHTKKQHVYCQTAKDPPTVLQCISYESKQAT